ncbi:MAG: ArgE/DapE family deacylase [candidate division KSB1 bacterium]|nr:ArgE/DapE family deacylase [candidate division KSB1 bacterium]MDZ7319470.1 ArgE/DapE family deacylase [candidate division KSB1 bacterium]MDZ7342417.1 ArgE/DapE family deacylase [candidate division KSB1 bacterium]
MDATTKIKHHFEKNRALIENRLIELTREMVRQKTVNVLSEKLPEHPYLQFRGEEYRVAEIVTRELERMEIPFEEFSRMKGRPNVIGRLGQNISGKRLLLPAHMDVVPAGNGWTHDPFDMIVKDGKLYGRGVEDNKGQLAAILVASEILKELKLDESLSGELLIAALADEEITDPDGIDYGIGFLLGKKLIQPTHAIVPDIGCEMRQIDIAEKGRLVIKITAHGQQAHGSTPEKGINAIFMMNKLLNHLETVSLPHEPHPVLGSPTLNLGEIHGGAAPNVVPASCVVYIDIRIVPGMTVPKVMEQLQAAINRIEGGHFTMELISQSAAFSIDPDNELVRLIQKYTQQELGFVAQPMGMTGGTYAKNLIAHQVLTVGWGPGSDTAHTANECIELQQLMDFTKIICLIALELLQ